MPGEGTGSSEDQVMILACFGRDATVLHGILAAAGVSASIAGHESEILAGLRSGVAALLLTVESLSNGAADELHKVLEEQPSWSEVPVLLLAAEKGLAIGTAPQLSRLLRDRNVVVLSRPLSAISLVTAIQSALQGRRRQYEVRDLLERERRARQQAEAAIQLKDDFLASVSHELRTPLSAILIWSRMLEAGQLSIEQVPTAIRAITSSAEAQSKLIEDLLDVSRMQAGKLRVDLRPQPLAPVLLAALDMVRPMAQAKGVHLPAPAQIECTEQALIDADRGQQIFWNLLKNAVQFTPTGGAVFVTVVRKTASVCVVVKDTGQGIAPAFLPNVFDAFRQADPSTSQHHGGLGLGLSIVKQLVALHGGSITASSEGTGHGASFVVSFPTLEQI
jgi:signal transduction histidine kinase